MDEQFSLEDQMVVRELGKLGLAVGSVRDLVKKREPYREAIPLLVSLLSVVKSYSMKEALAWSLSVKEAKGKAERVLLREFESSLLEDDEVAGNLRWAIANALEALGSKENGDVFIRLLEDSRSGNARGMLSLAAAKTKDPRLTPIFLENLETDDFLGFSAAGLGILGAREAIPPLKDLAARTKNSWVRREALTALRRLGVEPEALPARSKGKKSVGKIKRSPLPKTPAPEQAELVARLRALEACGITLLGRASLKLLESQFSLDGSDAISYRDLLCAMGEIPEDSDDEVFLSDTIWHFDTECIEGDGAYVAIAERLAVLAQGDLPLAEVEDRVDVEDGEGWLSFRLDGQPHKWPVRVDDDWVDPSVLSRFAQLLASRKTGRLFTYIDLHGQDYLLGCSTPEQKSRLEEVTGLKVEWLS